MRSGADRASGSGGAGPRRRPPRRAGTEAASSGRRSRARRPGARPRRSASSGSPSRASARRPRRVARSTNSLRISFASSAATRRRSGLITSCMRPVWSRRSTKTSPPWSRRRATQPASVSCAPRRRRAARRTGRLASSRGQPLQRHRRAATSSSSWPGADRGAVGSDDDGRRRPEARRLRQLALQRAARVVGVAGDAARLSSRAAVHTRARRAFLEREEDVDRGSGRLTPACSSASSSRSIPAPKPTPGVGGPADLLDQAVVASAARERALRALLGPEELPRRARVVVEAAHERRHELVGDAERVEVAANGREVLAQASHSESPIFGASSSASWTAAASRRSCRRRAAGWWPPSLASARRGVRRSQRATRAGARGRRAGIRGSRSSSSASENSSTPRPREQRVVELDDLGVDGRVSGADRLDRKLPVLAVAPALRRRVAVHGADGVELHGLRLAVHAVLDVRAADRCGRLRAQASASGRRDPRTCTSPSARRPSPRRTFVRRARCPRRRASRSAGSRRGRKALGLSDREPPERLLRGTTSCVPRGRSIFVALMRLRSARSSARNGLRASSSPSVVAGPWPGVDDGLGRKRVDERADRSRPACPSLRREGPCARRSPRRARRRRTGTRRRGRRDAPASARAPERTSNVRPARSSVSPPSSRTSGVCGRSVSPDGREAVRVLEQRALALGHVHRRARAVGEVGDADEVIPVAVRHEDRDAPRSEACEHEAGARVASPLGSTTTASAAGQSARTT